MHAKNSRADFISTQNKLKMDHKLNTKSKVKLLEHKEKSASS